MTINKTAGTLSTRVWTVTNNFVLTNGTFAPSTASSFNNVSLNGGTFTAPAGNINVSGNWTNSGGTFTAGTGTVTFNGTSAQTLGGTTATTFNNFTINNTNGITLTNNITVNTTLTFTGGRITTGVNNVVLPIGATATGNSSSYVNSNVRMAFTNVVLSRTFPIGDATNFAPLLLQFGAVSVNGNVTGSVTNAACGAPGINQARNVNHCWSLTNGGVTFTNYNATFNFVGVGTDADVGSNTATFIVGRNDGAWTYPTVGTRTATSTQATGMTTLGNTYEVGEPAPASLTIIKNVTNDDGGLATVTDFNVTTNTGALSFDAGDGGSPTTAYTASTLSVSAGTYTLSEDDVTGYTEGNWFCDSVDSGTYDNGSIILANGDDVTCTITNDDDAVPVTVLNVDSNPDTGDGSVIENEIILDTLGVTQLIVEFSEDVYDPALNTDPDDVTNPANYLLLRSASNIFATPGCGNTPTVVAPDVNIAVNSVSYTNNGGAGTFMYRRMARAVLISILPEK